MKKSAFAATLFLFIPGLGPYYFKQKNKVTSMMIAAFLSANLNIILLPLISMAHPKMSFPEGNFHASGTCWIPGILNDFSSLRSLPPGYEPLWTNGFMQKTQ